MKLKRADFKFSAAIILLFAIQSILFSCPQCNQEFYNELLGKRANTLGGQELLEAIKNQSIPGQQPSDFNLPYSINSLTDVQESNIPDTSDISNQIDKDNSGSKTTAEYLPYIMLFAKLFFFGKLIT
jgi:hypothetical protein